MYFIYRYGKELETRENVLEAVLETESPGNGHIRVELTGTAAGTTVDGTMEVLIARGEAERPEDQSIVIKCDPESHMSLDGVGFVEPPQFSNIRQTGRSKLRFDMTIAKMQGHISGDMLYFRLLDANGKLLSKGSLRHRELSGPSTVATDCNVLDPYVGQASTMLIGVTR
jgi:hypothetical protein